MHQGWIRMGRSGLALVYRLLDSLLISLLLLACLLAFDHNITKDWLIIGLIGVSGFAFLAESVDLYRSWRADGFLKMLGATSFAWVAVCSVLLLVGYFAKLGADYSRLVIGCWFVTVLFVLCVWRFALRQLLFYLRARDWNTRSTVIVGATSSGGRLARDIISNPEIGIRIRGFYRAYGASEDRQGFEKETGLRCLGNTEAAINDARSGKLDLVYIALPMRDEDCIAEILTGLADSTVTVHVLPDFFVANMLHARLYQVGESNLLSVYDTPIEGLNSWLKRLEDLILSTVILLLLTPLMLFIAVGIRLSSPGPIIFRQRRYGLDGRQIEVWKFRSMTCQDNGNVVVQARRNDPRITPFGAFLRRTSLDELPQFLNVLQGSMSIVGPRPHAVAHNEQYRSLVSGYMLRHKVKPGITGWAQVNGWRGETDTLDKMNQRVKHDLHYIRNWSIFLDIRIVLLTIIKGFTGKNAY
ncbi:undecaprenyl-phosphate glucose phosphotransferase [Microbulbifer hainanensis]|uniref:undecaprenyl-phosphate glucose phosphotransferase n=1 Tax=Microbulbifer hainanensis TaxID=2735675 RepID=UPI0018669BC9|nr:undecaprenyl-phosphate glucose phosphotransferase [Microbulbifer hainanensis]